MPMEWPNAPARRFTADGTRSTRYCTARCERIWKPGWRKRHAEYDNFGVPERIDAEFRRYLTCGILACGFIRARCGTCGHDCLLAFSCKTRGLCPSCATRRMVETAAHREKGPDTFIGV